MATIEAIYEHGVFKPLIPLSLIDGQYVKIIVELFEKNSSDDILELAAQVYNGLSEEDINDIEAIATDRQEFFGRNREIHC